MAEIREEAIGGATKPAISEQSTSALETEDCEKIVYSQSVMLLQNTLAKKITTINQEMEYNASSSEGTQNIDLPKLSDDPKIKSRIFKHKCLCCNVNAKRKKYSTNQSEEEEGLEGNCKCIPQESRENFVPSCQGKLEDQPGIHQELRNTKEKTEIHKVGECSSVPGSNISSKTSLSVSCMNCIIPMEESLAATSSGGTASSSISAEVCEKIHFDLDGSDFKLGQISGHQEKVKLSHLENVSALKEVRPHQGEDEYDHVCEGLVYAITSFPGSGIDQNEYVQDLIEGCRCNGVCSEGCTCIKLNGLPYKDGKLRDDYDSWPLFECNDDCSCMEGCPNRLAQRGPVVGLKIRHIPGKGYGVISSSFIPKHAFVCEYAGELISIQEARARFLRQSDGSNYILILREHTADRSSGPQITIIDPTVIGNIGRYINHSCDPNLVVVPVRVNSMVPLAALFAKKDIASGEELCYDYDSSENNCKVPHPHVLDATCVSQIGRTGCSLNAENLKEEGAILPSGPLSGSEGGAFPVQSISNDSNFHKTVYKPCLCKAKNCRGFLPVNDALF